MRDGLNTRFNVAVQTANIVGPACVATNVSAAAVLPEQFPDALGVYVQMVKSRTGVSDMTLRSTPRHSSSYPGLVVPRAILGSAIARQLSP
jgi:hypothetical protein